MQEVRVHYHPRKSHVTMRGARLEPGDTVELGDVCDRTDGTWALCHPKLIGTAVVEGCEMIILRPLLVPNACAQG